MIAPVLASSSNPVLKEIYDAQLPSNKTDDATNTSTVGQTSCDGEEVKVFVRLGGILPFDDEDVMSDQFIDDCPTAPQASPVSTSIDSLHSQIATLQEIASMESKEYQQRLMANSVQFKLQDFRLVRLSQSLHRFHSVILNLNEENDSQTREILHLQAQDLESQNKIAKLEAVVSKLVKQNQKLRHKNRSGRGINRKLVENLETIANVHRQEEEAIDKLLQHEQVLRERCDSSFSNFSNDLDSKSVDTLASNRSLVTSEPPTVRLHRQRNLTWPHSDFEEELSALDHAKSAADRPKSPKERTKSYTTAATTDHISDNDRNPSHKICEGGSSVTTADIWKASMRQPSSSSSSSNFWSTNSNMMSNDPHHKVNRCNILDLDEWRESPAGKYTSRDIGNGEEDDKHHKSDKQESDNPFLSIFQKTPQKRKSSDKKKDFDLFDIFKKDDAKDKLEEKQDDSGTLCKDSASDEPLQQEDHSSSENKDKSAEKKKDFDLFDIFKKDEAKSREKEETGTLTKESASNDSPNDGNNCPSETKDEVKTKEERQQDAADKFRSSMKNMGKMFTFH